MRVKIFLIFGIVLLVFLLSISLVVSKDVRIKGKKASVSQVNGKANNNQVVGEFCGLSDLGACETNNDCIVSGCIQQVCGVQQYYTTCEWKECYEKPIGVQCGCVQNSCQWTQGLTGGYCGDGVCELGLEDPESCPQDCGIIGICNNNNRCEPELGENPETCRDCQQIIGTCQGDFNNDNLVDDRDIDALSFAIVHNIQDQRYNLNGDLVVNELDFRFMIHNVLRTQFGDGNLDGNVDANDLALVRTNFGVILFAGSGGWALGNSNLDGVIDANDLAIVRTNFGFSNPDVHPGYCAGTILCCIGEVGDFGDNCKRTTVEECEAGGGIGTDCVPSEITTGEPKPGIPVNFTQSNVTGPLSGWINNLTRAATSTGVNNTRYNATSYDCDDFASDLERNLTALGYTATYTVYWCGTGAARVGHCVTDVHAPDGTLVFIEPQTNRIVNLDFDGDGVVEARNHHPAGIENTDDNCAIEVYPDRAAANAAGAPTD